MLHPSSKTLPRHEPPVIPVEPSVDPSVDATADLAIEMEHFGIGCGQGDL